jgi:cytochrome c peroxidase
LKTAVIILIVLLSSICIISLESCKRSYNEERVGTPIVFNVPNGWPQPQYNFSNNPLTEEGVELGRKLFYDGRLSKDGNYPCSGCHQQVAAFGTFDHDLSHGINNSHTLRNAPPLHNLAWQKEFGWDGAAKTIDQKITDHITSPNEMGETVENVLAKLRADAEYKKMFAAAFGDVNITADRLTKALSQFVLTMVSSNAKYDKVQRNEATFTTPEENGYNIFKQKCATCHVEPLFTDYTYRNIGIPVDPFLNDKGRLRVTAKSIDSLKFKVPSLRNADVTFPYGHDGRLTGYDQVFDHYRNGVVNGPTTDPLVINKIPLTNAEFGLLKSFLSTLTDTSFINNKKFGPR